METRTTSEVGLVKTNFMSIGVTDPLLVTRDPNFYRIKELKPIPNLLLVLSHEGTQNFPSFIKGGRRSSLRDHTIIKRG